MFNPDYSCISKRLEIFKYITHLYSIIYAGLTIVPMHRDGPIGRLPTSLSAERQAVARGYGPDQYCSDRQAGKIYEFFGLTLYSKMLQV
jgi:hypothetical protein